jgi:NAD(P)-dependent dehydrogenase (short-subunit alcohol dehydrogenase family)
MVVTKAAQLAIARGSAETNVGTGVTVNSVLPGPSPTRSQGVESCVQKLASAPNLSAAEVEAAFFRQARPVHCSGAWPNPKRLPRPHAFIGSPLASLLPTALQYAR